MRIYDLIEASQYLALLISFGMMFTSLHIKGGIRSTNGMILIYAAILIAICAVIPANDGTGRVFIQVFLAKFIHLFV